MSKQTPDKNTNRNIAVAAAVAFPHIGAIGKGGAVLDTGKGPKSVSVTSFAKGLKPGDIVLTGRPGYDVNKMFIAAGTGKPYGTHSMIVESVSASGNITFLHNNKALGFERLSTNPAYLTKNFETITAFRPVNSGAVLKNMRRYVDASESYVAALRARGVSEQDVLKIRKAAYRGKFNVAVALRQLFVPSLRNVNVHDQRVLFDKGLKLFERNISSYADVTAAHIKRTGNLPNINPLKSLGTVCSSALAYAGIDVGASKSLKFVTPADILKSTEATAVGHYAGKSKSLVQTSAKGVSRLLRAGPHLVRGGAGIGLGLLTLSAFKKVKVKGHTRRTRGGRVVRVRDYEKKAVDKKDAASGALLGAGAGLGVGVKDYYRSKGIHQGVDEQVRKGSRQALSSVKDKAKKTRGVKGWILRRALKKSKLDKVPELSIGKFPASKFRKASLKTGLAVGLPIGLAAMLASSLKKDKKKESSVPAVDPLGDLEMDIYGGKIHSPGQLKKRLGDAGVRSSEGKKYFIKAFALSRLQTSLKKRRVQTMPAEMKARIAARQGKPGKKKEAESYMEDHIIGEDDSFMSPSIHAETYPITHSSGTRGKLKKAKRGPHPQGDDRAMPKRKEYFAALKKRHKEETKQISPPYDKLKAAYLDPDPEGDDSPSSDAEVHNFDNNSSEVRSEDTSLENNKATGEAKGKGSDIKELGKKKRRFPRLKKHFPLMKTSAPVMISSHLARLTKGFRSATKPISGHAGTALNTSMVTQQQQKKKRKGKKQRLKQAQNLKQATDPAINLRPSNIVYRLLRKESSPRSYGSHYARSGYGTTEDMASVPWQKGHDPRKAKPGKRSGRPYIPRNKRPEDKPAEDATESHSGPDEGAEEQG